MSSQDEQAILKIFASYTQAFYDADADLMQSLFWTRDKRFTEIQTHIAEPIGRMIFLGMMGWIRQNGKPGQVTHFHDPQIFLLTGETAYSVARQEVITARGTSLNRVTMVYLKKDGEWRIIHAHFSNNPEEQGTN